MIPKSIFRITRQGTLSSGKVQDIVSAIAKAWNCMSPRLHQIRKETVIGLFFALNLEVAIFNCLYGYWPILIKTRLE